MVTTAEVGIAAATFLPPLSGGVKRGLVGKLAERVSVKDFGAIGDGTSHPVSQWLTGGALDRGFADLAALQAAYPHVTALTNEIDWVACQETIRRTFAAVGKRVYIPAGGYQMSQSLTWIDPTNTQPYNGVYLEGDGKDATVLRGTSALTAPIINMSGVSAANRLVFGGLSKMRLLGSGTSRLQHQIYIIHATAELDFEDIRLSNAIGWSWIVDGDTFFIRANRIYVEAPGLGFLRIKGTGPGFGTTPWSNGNTWSNVTYTGDQSRPGVRILEIIGSTENQHNVFQDWDIQSLMLKISDAFFYCEGGWNVYRNIKNYDAVCPNQTITGTSAGTSGKIRCACTNHRLPTGTKVAVSSTITQATGVYTVTTINANAFDLDGSTWVSSQAGYWFPAGDISATASGNGLIRATSTAHGLGTGQLITVAGITGAAAGPYRVVWIDDNTFDLVGTTFGGSTEVGTWRCDDQTANFHFAQPSGNGNIVDRAFGFNGAGFAIKPCQIRFSGTAAGNDVRAYDYSGNQGAIIYHCDPASTLNRIEVLRDDRLAIYADAAFAAGSGRLYELRCLEKNSAIELKLFDMLGLNTSATLANNSLAVGEYVWGRNGTGSDRNTGYPMRPGAGHEWQRLLNGASGAPAAFTASTIQAISGFLHGGSTGVATSGATVPALRYGMMRLTDLDASAASVGSPIFVSTTGTLTLTPPTTGFCILVGWVLSAANPCLALMRENFFSEYGRRARLGLQRFTADPALANMEPEQIAVSVVNAGNAQGAKLYYKSGANIYVFTSDAVI